MTQFHEGQEVEVARDVGGMFPYKNWRKAKLIRMAPDGGAIFNPVYEVQFPEPNGKYDVDGTRAVFDAEHIRAIEDYPDIEFRDRPYDEYGLNERDERRRGSP